MNIPNSIYKGRILEIINKLEFGTPEMIRNKYKEIYGTLLSWGTIKRHSETLLKEGIIDKQMLSKGKIRTIILYKKKNKKIAG